jgi:predicted TIM-barrel fold metal-dependent hydrolase
VVDADGHFYEPESLWDERLPARFRGMGPRHALDSMGQARLVIGGVTLPRYPSVPLPRRRDSRAQLMEPEAQRAGWDPAQRLRIMDAEGIDAHVIFPSIGLFLGGVRDRELLAALCRAYNDWASDFCRAAPGRLLAPAVVPQADVHETLREVERAVGGLGMAGVTLRPNPIGRPVEDPAWEPLWSLLEELDAPVAFHEGTNLTVPHLGADRTDNYLFQHMMSHPFEHMAALLSLIGGGVLERHPRLRAVFLEAGCGWVPYWLERMEQHLSGDFAYDAVALSLRPAEYFARQCFVSADPEEEGVVAAFVACLGDDTLCWSSDFPHPDHEWRGMVGRFAGRADLGQETKRKVMGANIARAYGDRLVLRPAEA